MIIATKTPTLIPTSGEILVKKAASNANKPIHTAGTNTFEPIFLLFCSISSSVGSGSLPGETFFRIGGKTKIINKIPSTKAGNHLPSTNIIPRSNQKTNEPTLFLFSLSFRFLKATYIEINPIRQYMTSNSFSESVTSTLV